jgi:drug/metabolite transporter (DMT)-like permease
MRTALFTSAALACFAANSLLCRLALAAPPADRIDAGSFTAIRLATGAVALLALVAVRDRALLRPLPGSWGSALALVVYAVPFSFAYLRLGAGPGALLLFAAVQLTMLGWSLARGDGLRPLTIAGALIALAGLVWLTLPGDFAPDPLGAALMVAAGAAWGAYTLRGRSAQGDPTAVTAANFVRSLPAVPLMALVVTLADEGAFAAHVTVRGAALAAASGALASGGGYSFWYAALPRLGAQRAAVLQLLVPPLAAASAVVLLSEQPSARLVGSSAVILGGVLVALRAHARP